jgi:hypothetical protein
MIVSMTHKDIDVLLRAIQYADESVDNDIMALYAAGEFDTIEEENLLKFRSSLATMRVLLEAAGS